MSAFYTVFICVKRRHELSSEVSLLLTILRVKVKELSETRGLRAPENRH